MKKFRLMILLAGLSVFAAGCGFSTGGEDSTVSVIHATPTPTPSPTPEVTPTPEATPTPAPVVSPTALGVNIVKQDGTYYTTTDVNLRQDCSTDNAAAPVLQGVPAGTQLTSTGVSEDGQWVEVNYNGTVCYASAQYLTTTAPAGAADAAAATNTTAAAQ